MALTNSVTTRQGRTDGHGPLSNLDLDVQKMIESKTSISIAAHSDGTQRRDSMAAAPAAAAGPMPATITPIPTESYAIPPASAPGAALAPAASPISTGTHNVAQVTYLIHMHQGTNDTCAQVDHSIRAAVAGFAGHGRLCDANAGEIACLTARPPYTMTRPDATPPLLGHHYGTSRGLLAALAAVQCAHERYS